MAATDSGPRQAAEEYAARLEPQRRRSRDEGAVRLAIARASIARLRSRVGLARERRVNDRG